MSTHSHKTGSLPPQSKLQEDRYLIVGLAGRGGMGAVYEAIDRAYQPHRRVAIKEMSQSQLTSHIELGRAKRRFRREAAMLGSLDHPNLPRVYNAFEEQGRLYLVTEFIEGQTLSKMLQAAAENPLPLEKVLSYACQLCDVLAYLHRQYPPVIFRDLKPSNVMVTAGGHVFLIDFGIARHFKEGQHHDTEAFGTLRYASPQQLDGAQTNVSSDLYSFGATLHHCLTGKVPAYAHDHYIYPPVRDFNPLVPERLDRLILSLVEVREDHRPKSAEAVGQELEAILRESEDLIRRVPYHGSILSAFPIGQPQQIRLPGDASGAPPGDETFSPNRPPLVVELWPEWMTDLANVYTLFVAWCSAVLIPGMRSLFRRTGHSVLDLLSDNRRQSALNQGKGIMRSLPGVSPADVRKGFSRIGHGITTGYEDVALLLSRLSSPVLTPLFIVLLLLRLALITGGSAYMFHAFHASYSIVAFCLSLLLLIIAGAASINTKIQDPIARSILFCTALAISIASFALQAFPDVQKVLHAITLSQLLSIALISTAFISLVRTTDRLAWVDHAAVVGIAGTCALLQYALGPHELQQIPVPGLTVDTSLAIIIGLAALLALIAFISLCRAGSSFSKADRVMLFGVALIYGCLQFSFGYEELQQLPLFTSGMYSSPNSLLNVAYVYVAFFAVPIMVAFIALVIGHRWATISRISIFVLAIACALLQNYLTEEVKISLSPPFYPLMVKILDLFTLNQIFIYGGLLVAGLLLLVRLARTTSWIERPAVFVLAIVSVFLQSSFWSGEVQQIRLPSPGTGRSGFDWVSLIALNQLFAGTLLFFVVSGVAMAVVILFVRVARPNAWIDHQAKTVENRFTWALRAGDVIERCVIFGILLVSTLLIAFFGGQGQILPQSVKIVSATSITISEMALPFLALFTLVAFFRISRPFNRWDGFMLFVAVIACTLLALGNTSVQYISPPVFSTLQQFMGQLLQGPLPELLLFFGLLTAAIISLLWFRRTPPRDRLLRIVLLAMFGGVIACTLLQYFWPILLLVALILLIHCVFLAIQMERVR